MLSCVFIILTGLQTNTLKLSFEFAKNGLALALLLMGSYFLIKRSFRGSVILFAMAAVTHKTASIFLAGFLITQICSYYFYNRNTYSRWNNVLFLILISISIIGTAVVFPTLQLHIINYFQHFALESINSYYESSVLISRPILVLIFFWLLLALAKIGSIASPLVIALIFFVLFPFFPIFSGDNMEIKFRLFIMAFPLAVLLFSITLPTFQKRHSFHLVMVVSLVILFSEAVKKTDFPWITEWSQKIKNLDSLNNLLTNADTLVTHHSLQFFIDYRTHIRGRSMISKDQSPIYQIAYTPDFFRLNPNLSDQIRQIQLLSLGDDYALFRFEDFQSLMKQNPILSDWRNLFQIRPEFVQDYK